MEIRDPIHGYIDLSSEESQILDSAAYQRLRSIKQLGFSEYSFPGATHNRFLHSVGVCHLAGMAFDFIFKNYPFKSSERRKQLRQVLRLAALLHDVGHGPLSHTTEEVMPPVSDLEVSAYKNLPVENRKANHEDYTIKFIVDSSLGDIIRKAFSDIDPLYVACLIDNRIPSVDDFFEEDGLCFRTILSQVISSELDVDRMDYLERDAFFCGTSYGKVETSWLLSNLTYHINSSHRNNLHLALNRRALYTFDDFLLSRHHMHLMVYFHHKSIIYEEMLLRYLTSKDCQFFLPADIDQYIKYTDYYLYEHLASVDNKWAQRIAKQNPYKMLFEFHSTEKTNRLPQMKQVLEEKGIHCILSNSTTRLSKYHSGSLGESERSIFVVDQYDKQANPYPIEKSTEIFHKYEEIRRIERIYVDPQHFMEAQTIIEENKL